MLKIKIIQYSGVFGGVFEPLKNKRQHKNVSPSRLFQSLVNCFYIHSHQDAFYAALFSAVWIGPH